MILNSGKVEVQFKAVQSLYLGKFFSLAQVSVITINSNSVPTKGDQSSYSLTLSLLPVSQTSLSFSLRRVVRMAYFRKFEKMMPCIWENLINAAF